MQGDRVVAPDGTVLGKRQPDGSVVAPGPDGAVVATNTLVESDDPNPRGFGSCTVVGPDGKALGKMLPAWLVPPVATALVVLLLAAGGWLTSRALKLKPPTEQEVFFPSDHMFTGLGDQSTNNFLAGAVRRPGRPPPPPSHQSPSPPPRPPPPLRRTHILLSTTLTASSLRRSSSACRTTRTRTAGCTLASRTYTATPSPSGSPTTTAGSPSSTRPSTSRTPRRSRRCCRCARTSGWRRAPPPAAPARPAPWRRRGR